MDRLEHNAMILIRFIRCEFHTRIMGLQSFLGVGFGIGYSVERALQICRKFLFYLQGRCLALTGH